MTRFTEDVLVQQTTADYLRDALGWESVYAFNNEDFGPDSLLGRASGREVVLQRYLRAALERLNPGLPDSAYADAVRTLVTVNNSQSLASANRSQYRHIRDGVPVICRDSTGETIHLNLRVLDFDRPENNHFLCVRELKVRGDLYNRRPDIMGFVNGLPLVFMELKNVSHDVRLAYDRNFRDYRDTVPHLFHHNAVVIFGNGIDARVGSVTSRFEHFQEWKRLEEEAPGSVDMETLLKGICHKRNLLDLVENFIVFDHACPAKVQKK